MVVDLRSPYWFIRFCYGFVTAGVILGWALYFTLLVYFKNDSLPIPSEILKPSNRSKFSPSQNYDRFKEECSKVLNKRQCSGVIASRLKNPTDPWHSSKFVREDDFIDLSRVLLVVQFNEPFYSTASKIYELYSPIFAEIVFCGSEDSQTQFWPLRDKTRKNFPIFSLPKSVRFVGYGKPVQVYSENGYYCLNRALDGINSEKYDGIMLSADDLVLNFWQWKKARKTLFGKVWLMSDQLPGKSMFEIDGLNFCNGTSRNNGQDCPRTDDPWVWAQWYQHLHLNFYNDLEMLSKTGDLFWKAALNNLTRVTNGTRRVFRGFADTFYVSRDYLPTILPIFELMNKYRVFAETAVPTALRMVTANQPDDLQMIDSAGHDWGLGRIRRQKMVDAYLTSYEIVHPVKWSLAFKTWETYEIHARDREIDRELVGTNAGAFYDHDASATCAYCFLLNMTHSFFDTFYKQ